MVDFERLARPGLRDLRAYDPGHDLVALRRSFAEAQLVELGSNENPYGASPKAIEAIVAALPGIHIYPDPLGGDLKRALAERHGVQPASILLGNGSHELLMQFAQVFAGPGDEVVASKFGFAVYALAAIGPDAEPALPALVEALKSRSAPMRLAAVYAIPTIAPGAPSARPALQSALRDRDPEVRAEAGRAIRRIRNYARYQQDAKPGGS